MAAAGTGFDFHYLKIKCAFLAHSSQKALLLAALCQKQTYVHTHRAAKRYTGATIQVRINAQITK